MRDEAVPYRWIDMFACGKLDMPDFVGLDITGFRPFRYFASQNKRATFRWLFSLFNICRV